MIGRKEEDGKIDGQIISQLGATIRAWRTYRGLSARDVAISAGLDEKQRSYISKIEQGYIKRPDMIRLQAIAAALGTTSNDLLRYRKPPTINHPTAAAAELQPILEVLNRWFYEVEDRLKASLGEVIEERMSQLLSRHLPVHPSPQAGEPQEPSEDQQIIVNITRPPLIGIPCYAGERAGSMRPLYGINRVYVEALEQVGGTAVLIPHTKNIAALYPLCTLLHGLLLPGGADIDPLCYHDEPHPALGQTDLEEDRLDLALVDYFLEMDLPILGINRGMQLINIARGGTLYQDIASQRPESLRHNYDYTPWQANDHAHPIAINPDSRLADLLGSEPLMVNSFHHQAINEVGKPLAASAWAPDGIIEGLESPQHRFVVGVQFQAPELLLQEDRRVIRLFQGFIKAASRIKRAL